MAQWQVSSLRIVAAALLLLIGLAAVATGLIMLTPLRQLLPGYMRDEQRMQTEQAMMRVDSLTEEYKGNDAYVKNLLEVFNTGRTPGDASKNMPSPAYSTDSLMQASDRERKFVADYSNRERYNVSILAPLAAGGMRFSQVSGKSIISYENGDSTRAVVRLANGEGVGCMADGVVLDVGYSPKEGGATCIIQHDKGFVSRYSRLGRVMVKPGDEVIASQIIALQTPGTGRDISGIVVQLWRNGDALAPKDFLRKNREN